MAKRIIQKREYANYNVAMKILLKRNGKYLFLVDSSGKKYDLPGGRIDNVEHNVPLEKTLEREVREELGKNLKYKLGNPIFQFRRHISRNNTYVFITVYSAQYISGDVRLSEEHCEFNWFSKKNLDIKSSLFWSKEEYIAFKKYFQ